MNAARAIFRCICLATALQVFALAETTARDLRINETVKFDVSPGIQFYIATDKAGLNVKMSALIAANQVEARGKEILNFKGEGILEEIGSAIVMAPVLLQLISLPGTLASLKFSLLRSIFIGKIALAIMLFSFIRNYQKPETIVVHRPVHHEHYYHTEEEDNEWWARRMKRQTSFAQNI